MTIATLVQLVHLIEQGGYLRNKTRLIALRNEVRQDRQALDHDAIVAPTQLTSSEPPPGFSIVPNMISETEETEITAATIAQLDNDERLHRCWIFPDGPKGRRRVAFYGEYDACVPSQYQISMPPWLSDLSSKIRTRIGIDDAFECIGLCEYVPGTGVAPHVDSHYFADRIVVLNLGEVCTYSLRRIGTCSQFRAPAPRRSLVIMDGASRRLYEHSIDVDPSSAYMRHSIVFRSRPINPKLDP